MIATLKLNIQYHINRDAQMMQVYVSNTLCSVDNTLKDMGRVSLIAFSDQKVQEILKEKDYSFTEKMSNEEYLTNLYSSMISIRNDVKGIYIFNNEEMVFYNDVNTPFLGFEWNVSSFFEDVKSNSDLSADISGCHMYVDSLPKGFRYIDKYENDIYQNNNIYLVRPIRSFDPFEIIGYIALRTPIQTLKNICDDYLENDVSYIMADEEYTIACCSNEESVKEKLSTIYPEMILELNENKGTFSILLNGIKYLCVYKQSDYSKILLITLKPYEAIYAEMNILVFTCGLVFVFSAVIILASVYIFTRKSLHRLTDFSLDIQNFQPDDLTRQYEVGYLDEVGILKDSFNKMIQRLNTLVILEYQARDELQKAEISEQKMAMLYLKQQINPHFLYNTLDMIRLKAAMNRDLEVSHMLMKLVIFYRLSTKVDSSMVTVQQEVNMLEAYMSLMCYRYSDIKYHTNIEADTLKQEIPNFILQPLMENCLLHGLKDRRYQGNITLKIYRKKGLAEELVIEISDDGVGIPDDKLKELNAYSENNQEALFRVQTQTQEEYSHLGVRNVISRLKLYYHENCIITYSKNETGGTTVTIRMKSVSEIYE